ncbi:MAG: glycosyltransferase family 4 protein [Pseudomonadota bacterium]
MNVLILNTQIPFCYGGAEVLAEDLTTQVRRAGHRCEVLTLPFKWYPQQTLSNTMIAARLMDISSFNGVTIDRVIALKFPMWLIPHSAMSLWILHQHRAAYDLWDSQLSDLASMPDGKALRDLIRREDTAAISAADSVCTISRNVTNRLKQYNKIDSQVVYPPPRSIEKFRADSYGDYLFFPSRISSIKRQELVIEALAHAQEPVKVVFAGEADSPQYLKRLQKKVGELGLDSRVQWSGFISEQEKLDLYANALAVVFTPVDEDYGYVTPEAMLASKAVITLEDSGGATEFVQHDRNGLIVKPEARELALALDRLWSDRNLAEKMGSAARDHFVPG